MDDYISGGCVCSPDSFKFKCYRDFTPKKALSAIEEILTHKDIAPYIVKDFLFLSTDEHKNLVINKPNFFTGIETSEKLGLYLHKKYINGITGIGLKAELMPTIEKRTEIKLPNPRDFENYPMVLHIGAIKQSEDELYELEILIQGIHSFPLAPENQAYRSWTLEMKEVISKTMQRRTLYSIPGMEYLSDYAFMFKGPY